ncbi:MAG: helix-turn-helix domain-containing protein [Thermoplasmata archaeon]
MTILGKMWTLCVISLLGNEEVARFNELLAGLRFISSRTLTDRLEELVALGLAEREEVMNLPRRVEYRLTLRGRELRDRLLPPLDWAIGFETAGAAVAG